MVDEFLSVFKVDFPSDFNFIVWMCVLVHTFGGLFIQFVVLLFLSLFFLTLPIDSGKREEPPPSRRPFCFSPKSPNCTRKRGEAFYFIFFIYDYYFFFLVNTSNWLSFYVRVRVLPSSPLSHAETLHLLPSLRLKINGKALRRNCIWRLAFYDVTRLSSLIGWRHQPAPMQLRPWRCRWGCWAPSKCRDGWANRTRKCQKMREMTTTTALKKKKLK